SLAEHVDDDADERSGDELAAGHLPAPTHRSPKRPRLSPASARQEAREEESASVVRVIGWTVSDREPFLDEDLLRCRRQYGDNSGSPERVHVKSPAAADDVDGSFRRINEEAVDLVRRVLLRVAVHHFDAPKQHRDA